MEVGAVGTVQLICTGQVVIAARVQSSIDGGHTFSEGLTFAAINKAASFKRLRTVTTQMNLFVAEVAGEPVTFEATMKDDVDAVIDRETYEVRGFAQQIVSLSKMREKARAPRVELRVIGGTGELVVGEETHDPALLDMTARMTAGARSQAQRAPATATSGSASAAAQLFPAFKGTAFRDPLTGLVLMRDRWYEPSSGTFLSPDPEGYADSSNLYIFGKGDPVNNSDPTGRYIDEEPILNSPLRNRYIAWRDDFRSSPLGREAWDRIHAIPASRFTLSMAPMSGRADDTGAVASRTYDTVGTYIGGRIEFGPKFGATSPPDNPRSRLEYPRAFDVERGVIFSRRPFRVYSFGHEFGHILSGFDPAQAAAARQFTNVQAQQTQLGEQILPLVQKRVRSGLTPAEQQFLNQLLAQQQRLEPIANALKLGSEQYGDAIGYQFFRSWHLDHHRRPNPNPPPALPAGALPPP